MLDKVLLKAWEVWCVCQTFSRSEFVARYLPPRSFGRLSVFLSWRTQTSRRSSWTCLMLEKQIVAPNLCSCLLAGLVHLRPLILVNLFLSWGKNSHRLNGREKPHISWFTLFTGEKKKIIAMGSFSGMSRLKARELVKINYSLRPVRRVGAL